MLHPAIYKSFEAKNFGLPSVLTVNGAQFLRNTNLHHKVSGPFTLVEQCENKNQLEEIISALEG